MISNTMEDVVPPPLPLFQPNAPNIHTIVYYIDFNDAILQPGFANFEACYAVASSTVRLHEGELVYEGVQDAKAAMAARVNTMMVEFHNAIQYTAAASIAIGVDKHGKRIQCCIHALLIPSMLSSVSVEP